MVLFMAMVPFDGFRASFLGGDRDGRSKGGPDTPRIVVAAMLRRCHCVKRLDLVIDVSPAVLGGLLVVVIIEERCPGQEEARMQQTRDVADLVHAAQQGDQSAWNDLVDRFLPLVTAVVRRYRLSEADADDVNQTVWLRLVEHLDEIREPRALPGWLVTTTRNEALRVIRRRGRDVPLDPHGHTLGLLYEVNDMDEGMIRDEVAQALRDALLELSPARRELLTLLLADPPLSYDEISNRLGIPIGSIGPTRARALEQLRNTKAMRALMASANPASEA
jgi:RNA polymerase sigma factor (sigma-70 family)